MRSLQIVLVISQLCFAGSVFNKVKPEHRPYWHFGLSAGASFVSCLAIDFSGEFADLPIPVKYSLGFSIGMIPGFAKEFSDKKKGAIFDWNDIGMDALGAGAGVLLYAGLAELFDECIVVSVDNKSAEVKLSFNL